VKLMQDRGCSVCSHKAVTINSSRPVLQVCVLHTTISTEEESRNTVGCNSNLATLFQNSEHEDATCILKRIRLEVRVDYHHVLHDRVFWGPTRRSWNVTQCVNRRPCTVNHRLTWMNNESILPQNMIQMLQSR
jgi:hypothetical protein